MQRITVRVDGVGPIGFCRAAMPATLAQLRASMAFQLADALPSCGFRFVSAGQIVAMSQEVHEDLLDGDVFIVAMPEGDDSSTPVARSAMRSLSQQWVEAFGFM